MQSLGQGPFYQIKSEKIKILSELATTGIEPRLSSPTVWFILQGFCLCWAILINDLGETSHFDNTSIGLV